MIIATILLAQAAAQQPTVPFDTEGARIPKLVTKGTCLIRGGRVITVTGPVYTEGDVLVVNGKIKAIGPNLSAPQGATIIDAKGKFVTPGIVDAHSHMAASSSVNEFSDSITDEVRIADIIDPDSSSFYYKLSSGFTSSLVLHGSANAIGGESQIIKLKWKRPIQEILFKGAPRIVKFALGENVTNANDSEPPSRFPMSRMGVEQVYRRAFDQARSYMATWDRYNKNKRGVPPRKDLRLQTLADILDHKVVVHCHSYRQDEMLMMARLSQEYNFKLVFTHSLEAYKISPELAKAGIGASSFADAWSYKVEVMDAIPYNAAISWHAGVLMSINTDTFSGMTPLNMDAAKSMRFGGVPPEECIKFVTINPAKQLGIDKMTGSLEVGKDGDIVVWSGNPMSVYSRCDMTLIEGEVMYQRRDQFGLDSVSKRAQEVAVSTATDLPVAPASSSAIAIVGADVYPISDAPIMGGVVVISDGKISAVGKNITVPTGAFVVDAKGMKVFPGFIDAQSEIGRNEIGSVRATQDASELGRFQPDLVALDAVNPESLHIPITRLGGVTATMERPRGPVVAGQGSLMNLDGWTTELLGVVRQAALYINYPAGPESIPSFFRDTMTAEELQRQKDFAEQQRNNLRDYLEMAKRYLVARKEDPNGTQLDTRLEALAPYLNGEKPVVISAATEASIKAAVKLGQDLKLKTILAGGNETWRAAEFLAQNKIPVVLEPVPVNVMGASGGEPARDYDPYDAVLSQPAILHRAGVTFAFGSGDSALSYELPMRAGLACTYGLPEDVALKALTINAANMFGVGDRMGSLSPGKMANIVIVDGDPFEISTHVRGLFINGKAIPLKSHWTELYDKYMQRVRK